MTLWHDAIAPSFDTNHAHIGIIQEGMKQADGIAATTDTGDEQIWQFLLSFQDLLTRFDTDDAVKITHHHREGMGT